MSAARHPDPAEELPTMGLLQHLDELRKRILWSLVALVVTFMPAWYFIEPLCDFLEAPIKPFLKDGQQLTVTSVTEAFLVKFKVAALAALFLAAPFVLLQLWRFVAPGLYRREKALAVPFIAAGTAFFLAGGAFAYYVAFPMAVQFLLGMGERYMLLITARSYLGFLMTMILGLGLMFELPIIIFLLCAIGVTSPRFLMRHFRWAVVLIFTTAAIITPTPDVVNLSIFALPTLGLYLLGVGASALFLRRRARAVPAEEPA
ncbi:MAG TPA: twin-arginine translocase subunit TatC [Thermoanaerobaculia bacterium]|nr:twin-arginine translocase subunit TatC [Thermoanaerobaculia bacterium]